MSNEVANNDKKAEKKKQSILKKWWFWVIVVVIIIGIASAGSNKNNDKKVGENSSSESSSQESNNSEQTVFAVGDVISHDNVEITVNSVQRNAYTDNEYYKPDSGKEFIKVNIKIENKTDSKISYGSYDWKIQDSNGVISDIDSGIQYTADGALGSGELAAGGKQTGDLYFEVPKDDKGLVLQYTSNIWADKTVDIKL